MLNPAVAQAVIDRGLFLGADFVDLFVENQKVSEVELLSSEIEKLNTGIDFGIGLRMVVGTNVLYGYTNHTDKEQLLKVIDLLGSRIGESLRQSHPLTLKAIDEMHPVQLPLSAGLHGAEGRVPRRMDQAVRGENEKITIYRQNSSTRAKRRNFQFRGGFISETFATTVGLLPAPSQRMGVNKPAAIRLLSYVGGNRTIHRKSAAKRWSNYTRQTAHRVKCLW